jgi:hypothetical protein
MIERLELIEQLTLPSSLFSTYSIATLPGPFCMLLKIGRPLFTLLVWVSGVGAMKESTFLEVVDHGCL